MAVAACSASSSSSQGGPPDAAPTDGSVTDGTVDAGPGRDAQEEVVVVPNFCCNASPDPCCEYFNCEGGLTPPCSAELDCEDAGGTYTAFMCVFPDAGAGDAAGD